MADPNVSVSVFPPGVLEDFPMLLHSITLIKKHAMMWLLNSGRQGRRSSREHRAHVVQAGITNVANAYTCVEAFIERYNVNPYELLRDKVNHVDKKEELAQANSPLCYAVHTEAVTSINTQEVKMACVAAGDLHDAQRLVKLNDSGRRNFRGVNNKTISLIAIDKDAKSLFSSFVDGAAEALIEMGLLREDCRQVLMMDVASIAFGPGFCVTMQELASVCYLPTKVVEALLEGLPWIDPKTGKIRDPQCRGPRSLAVAELTFADVCALDVDVVNISNALMYFDHDVDIDRIESPNTKLIYGVQPNHKELVAQKIGMVRLPTEIDPKIWKEYTFASRFYTSRDGRYVEPFMSGDATGVWTFIPGDIYAQRWLDHRNKVSSDSLSCHMVSMCVHADPRDDFTAYGEFLLGGNVVMFYATQIGELTVPDIAEVQWKAANSICVNFPFNTEPVWEEADSPATLGDDWHTANVAFDVDMARIRENPERYLMGIKNDGVFCLITKRGDQVFVNLEDGRSYVCPIEKFGAFDKHFFDVSSDTLSQTMAFRRDKALDRENWLRAGPDGPVTEEDLVVHDGLIVFDRYGRNTAKEPNFKYFRYVNKVDVKSKDGILTHPIFTDISIDVPLNGVYEVYLPRAPLAGPYLLFGRYRGNKRVDKKPAKIAKCPTIYDFFPGLVRDPEAALSELEVQRMCEADWTEAQFDGLDFADVRHHASAFRDFMHMPTRDQMRVMNAKLIRDRVLDVLDDNKAVTRQMAALAMERDLEGLDNLGAG
jgi:hypothetical protein